MIWICISAGHGISHLVKIYSFKNWPLEKLWGWGQGIFELHEISLVWIFLGVLWPPPPPPTPPINFLKSRPLIMNMHKIFTWVICVNGEHLSFINVNCAIRARRLKGRWKGIFLTSCVIIIVYSVTPVLLFTCIRGLLIIQSALSWRTPPMLTDTSILTNISVYRPLRVGPLPFLIPFIWLYIRRTSLEAGHLVVVPLGHPTTASP